MDFSDVNFNMISLILIVFLVLYYVYYIGNSRYDFWKKLNVPYVKPKFPLFGNLYEAAFSLKPTFQVHRKFYKHFNEDRFGGLFAFCTPVLMIRDAELIESILIKDFYSFHERGNGADIELDPLAAHLLNLEGIKWKKLRQKLAPTFTSGKLINMHPLIVECAEQLVKRCMENVKLKLPIKTRDVMGKFSTDVIGSCAFGLDVISTNDANSKFTDIVKLSARSNIPLKLRTAIRGKLPGLLKLLKWKNQPKVVQDFFFSFIKNAVSFREKNNIYRNDFLQLMMEIKKKDSKKLCETNEEDRSYMFDDRQMTASSYQFLAAGYATTSLTLTFCLFEIAKNQDIQEKIYQEILGVITKYEYQFTYQAIKEMEYLRQVLLESMRMHPTAPNIIRRSTTPYQIPKTDIVIPKGTDVLIPIYSIHHDSKFFPDPSKFIPERFSEENKNNMTKCTFLSFGDGPRMCIATRFAKLEALIGIAKLVYEFKLTLNSKTKCPMVYKKSGTFTEPADDVWIDLSKRT